MDDNKKQIALFRYQVIAVDGDLIPMILGGYRHRLRR